MHPRVQNASLKNVNISKDPNFSPGMNKRGTWRPKDGLDMDQFRSVSKDDRYHQPDAHIMIFWRFRVSRQIECSSTDAFSMYMSD